MSSIARIGRIVVLAGAIALGACDSGLRGPGVLVGRVSGEALGGVVLEVEGTGIRGFSARGGARAYSAPLVERPNTHRLVVIAPTGSELSFEIQVEDVGMEGPVVTVLQLARTDDTLTSPAGATVRIER